MGIIIAYSVIPFSKTLYQTETCKMIMQYKLIDWFIFDKELYFL